jgi:catechol 2,3-dioxygenase-like lactoylglutathione lyase family enzyme
MSMNKLPDAQLGHIGIYAFDLEKMVDFYSRVFGLMVTDRGKSGRGVDIAFLSRDPIEHHQVAIAAGRPKDAVHSTVQQISFRVSSLENLREYYPWLVKERVAKLDPRTHGNAWSIYFADPEGNRVELYCSSPWYVGQPFGEPFDPTEPAEVIRAKTEAMVKQDPTWQPMDVWVADMKRKLEKQTVPA